MKTRAFAAWIAAAAVAASSACAGTGPVAFNNYDANGGAGCPIYYGYYDFSSHTTIGPYFLPNDGMNFVQLYVNGSPLLPGTGRAIVLDEPGYFDFGPIDTNVGDNMSATFKIELWKGTSGSTFASSIERTAMIWTQNTGSYPTGVPPPPPAPATLTFGGAGSIGIILIPEPATITLGLLGGLALFARRRFKL